MEVPFFLVKTVIVMQVIEIYSVIDKVVGCGGSFELYECTCYCDDGNAEYVLNKYCSDVGLDYEDGSVVNNNYFSHRVIYRVSDSQGWLMSLGGGVRFGSWTELAIVDSEGV
jgi:hypothetical protein